MAISYGTITSGTTWANWTNSSGTASTNSATDTVWLNWTDAGTTGSITTSSTTDSWNNWVIGDGNRIYIGSDGITEEQRRKLAEEKAERERKRKEAQDKADKLLKSLLTPEQIEDLEVSSFFIVTSEKGNVYRIKKGWAGNVERIDKEGNITDRFCIHPKMFVPHADNMVIQKLMLEANEDEFLKIANRTRVRIREGPEPVAA